MKILNPVILAVPEKKRNMPPKERTAYLSGHARIALGMSAEYSGMVLGPLEKDDDGVPLPSNGIYWCITHKPCFVGGVVSRNPVGLDLEEIRPCNNGLFKKVAGPSEWDLSQEEKFKTFFRYWTAKESLIKLRGTGIRDMRKCRVAEIPDDRQLVLSFAGKRYLVSHTYFKSHIAAIITGGPKPYWRIH